MNKQLQQLLAKATETELKEIVTGIFGLSSAVDARIESMLLTSSPKALAIALKNRIAAVKRGRSFIDYRLCAEFSGQLDAIVDDITLLVDSAPQLAFELVDAFIATHTSVYERSDDSSGYIGMSYQEAVTLWLKVASAWRVIDAQAIDWVEVVFNYHNDNEYAVWDELISGSGPLLSDDELTQLVWRFEAQFKQAQIQDDSGYSAKNTNATFAIAGVAQALGSVELYERATFLRSPSPNELQKANIVEFCLGVNDGDAALKWLAPTWSGYHETTRLGLLDKTLNLLGKHDELRALRVQQYELQPDHLRLSALLEVSSGEQANELRQHALGKSLSLSNLTLRIRAVIDLGAVDIAAAQIIESRERCDEICFSHLGDITKVFVKAGEFVAAVICYRSLLEDILNDGRSKAYHYAASYYQKLATFDEVINDYQPIQNWQEYQECLRKIHGRKSAFWRRIK